MLPSEIPRLATDPPVRAFPGVGKLRSFLRLPSWDGSPSLPLLSLFLSFIFCPTSFWRQWAALLGAWCPLPAFRSCFVEPAQCSKVLLMNLWGRKWSPVLFLRHLRTTPFHIYFYVNLWQIYYIVKEILLCNRSIKYFIRVENMYLGDVIVTLW